MRSFFPDFEIWIRGIRFVSRIGFFGLLAAALYYSLSDTGQTPISAITWDKLNHCLGYFSLILFFDLAYGTGRRLFAKAAAVFSYGVMLEVAQYMLPYRQFSLLDTVANAAGIIGFFLLWFGLQRFALYRRLQDTGYSPPL
ncbi:MAG: VanZ family protein [Thermodesulfobacteriota bacterium]